MAVCLVTGGAGFIGSHLCEQLLADGQTVLCVDNFSSGTRSNIAHLVDNGRFSLIQHDVKSGLQINKKVDFIFHLASRASPKDFTAHAIDLLLTNALGTSHLLELAKSHSARFLLASTSEVYGNPQVHPQPETYWGSVNPTGIRSCYDESKRFAEALSMAYHRSCGLDVRIARIFNTYGPRFQPGDGRVVPNFVSQALSHQSLTVYGDGTQTRSFCYVTDLVRGLAAFMFREGLAGEVINLGNDAEQRISDVAALIISLARSSSAIAFADLPPDDPERRQPDISKAAALLEWTPQVTLEDGLRRTISWFTENHRKGE